MFDYIFKYTGQKDLYFIGHSMGTSSLFALLSTKPEYNVKIRMAICLAPAAFWMEVSPTFTEIVNTLPIVTVNAKICDFLLQAVVFKIQSKIKQSLFLPLNNMLTILIAITN
jgi:pimeloyl-ACP methyl ester carboxylesterase